MRKKSTIRHLLVLTTAGLFLMAMLGVGVFRHRAPPPVSLNETEDHPLIGRAEAPMSFLLIEDFHYPACRKFMSEIFPLLYRQYIESGRAHCIFVPVAFLEGSKPIANAALAVYRIAPSRFLSYMQALYGETKEELTIEDLLGIARQVGGIDMNQLQLCLDINCLYAQIDANLDWAKKIMGSDFGVPALFINGIPSSTSSFSAIDNQIKAMRAK